MGGEGMATFNLSYGNSFQAVALPESSPAITLLPRETSALPEVVSKVKAALREPTESPPIAELVSAGQRVVILVNDITRVVGSNLFLPPLLDELNRAGVRDTDISIVFATGSHRGHTQAERQMLVGDSVAARVRLYDHDAHNYNSLVTLGSTSRGTPIQINQRVADADCIILTGSVSHHYFAGYGGGRKSLVPGVAGIETIERNHSLMLDDRAVTGNLSGNPVHEDLIEACHKLHSLFLFNVVLNQRKEIIQVFAGNLESAHLCAANLVDDIYGVPIPHEADLVIASCGGFPKDINAYQAHKALENAARAVRPGGAIVLLAACPDGVGSDTFLKWMSDHESAETIARDLRTRFHLGGHKAYAVARLTAKAQVLLVSDLPETTVRTLMMTPAGNAHKAVEAAMDWLGVSGPSIIVMPDASTTYPLRNGK